MFADGPFDPLRLPGTGAPASLPLASAEGGGPGALPRGTLLLDARTGLRTLARLLTQVELRGDISRVHVAGPCPGEVAMLIAEVAGVPVSRAGASGLHHPRPGPPLERLTRLAVLHAYLRGGHLATAALNWLRRGDAAPAPDATSAARFAPGGGARIIPFPGARRGPGPQYPSTAASTRRLAAGGEADPLPAQGTVRPGLRLASGGRQDMPRAEQRGPTGPETGGDGPRGADPLPGSPPPGSPPPGSSPSGSTWSVSPPPASLGPVQSSGDPDLSIPSGDVSRLQRRGKPERLLAERVDPAFVARLLAHVRRRGAIPFSEYQRWCHMAPGGFYEAGTVSIGNVGSMDFPTAPEQSPVFGRVTARALHAMFEAMGGTDRFSLAARRPFHIVEMGAGNGTWARDILGKIREAYPDFHARLRYVIVERSPALIARQQARLQHEPVQWILGSAARLPLADIEGAAICNELLDDLDVSLVYRDQGSLHEVHVAANDQDRFVEVGAPLSASARAALRFYEPPAEGQTITLNTGAIEWMQRLGRALRPGSYALTIDYGGRDASALPPWGFFRTKVDLEWAYRFPGAMNITGAVSFGHLARAGRAVGLVPGDAPRFRPLQSQGAFLAAYGLQEELRAQTDPRQARLANRLGFGGFCVMVQRKVESVDLSAPAPTRGS